MSIPKTDRRVIRTRRQLSEALMTLILEKGYDAVTIEEITERADLGRTTFYLHYRDKEELLLESLEAIAEDLKQQVERLAEISDGAQRSRPVAVAFQHAAEHRNLYRIILKGEGGSKVSSRIRDIITEAASGFIQRRRQAPAGDQPEVPTELVAGYFASALMGFMTWWLEKDLPYSGDEAAEVFTRLFFRGARQVLHLANDAE